MQGAGKFRAAPKPFAKPTWLCALGRKRKELKRLWNVLRFWIPLPLAIRKTWKLYTWIQHSFAWVRTRTVSPLWDTSVMGSVSPIVDFLLDEAADNILPSGHLRSMITLHLAPLAHLQGMSMHQRTEFENAWFQDNPLAFFFSSSAPWQPFNMMDPLTALKLRLTGRRRRDGDTGQVTPGK